MVAQYTVFGRQVGSHVVSPIPTSASLLKVQPTTAADAHLHYKLAMLTLGTTAAGSTWALAGKEKAKEQGPPINAQSNEEEQFIQFVDTEPSSCERILTLFVQGIHKERTGRGAKGEALDWRWQGA